MQKKIQAHCKIWLTEPTGKTVFGYGKYKLLKEIERTGTITEAALNMGMSYRKAWGQTRAMENGLGLNLFERLRGGVDKGGVKLTEQAKKLISIYEKFDFSLHEYFTEIFKDFSINLTKEGEPDEK